MPTITTDLDQEAAHRFFAAHCFNEAWILLRKAQRTRAEDIQLLTLSHASLYHWSQRPDVSRQNYAIAYWQLSRAYAMCGEGENARRWGLLCQEQSAGEGAFFEGYACEALARAARVAGDTEALAHYRAQGLALAAAVEDLEERAQLLSDLDISAR